MERSEVYERPAIRVCRYAFRKNRNPAQVTVSVRTERRDKGLCKECGAPAPPDPTRAPAANRALSEGRSVAAHSGEGKEGWTFERLSTWSRCEKCETKRTIAKQKKEDRKKKKREQLRQRRATLDSAGLCRSLRQAPAQGWINESARNAQNALSCKQTFPLQRAEG